MVWRCNNHHGRVLWRVTVWDRMDSSDQRYATRGIVLSHLQWSRGVNFRTLFAVGFRACIIGGASVIRRMVRMGDSSITLCSSSFTLCSTCGVLVNAGGWRISLIFDWSSLISRHPFLVALAIAVDSANSSVIAQKCCYRVMFGIWQCWGNSSVEPKIWYAWVSRI